MKKLFFCSFMLTILTTLATNASASFILDFEGIGSQARIEEFYNGGTDSMGNSGVNYGVSFGSNALALTESDPQANFSGEPSEETAMFFLTGSAILNYDSGFDTGFSFYYSTVSYAGSVSVYDDLNATGNLLGTIAVEALGYGPDEDNPFSNWEIGFLGFSGIGKSIDFGGTVNQVGYDNITFGSINPNIEQPIPEPTTMLLFGIGLLGLAGASRKKTA